MKNITLVIMAAGTGSRFGIRIIEAIVPDAVIRHLEKSGANFVAGNRNAGKTGMCPVFSVSGSSVKIPFFPGLVWENIYIIR